MTAAVGPDHVYVDSSVLVALLANDDASHRSARAWARREGAPLLTSVLAEVEIRRALQRRQADQTFHRAAGRLLARVEQVEVTATIRALATEVHPTSVRSLDALHIGTAQAAGVRRFASLDERQRVAAEEMGMDLVDVAH